MDKVDKTLLGADLEEARKELRESTEEMATIAVAARRRWWWFPDASGLRRRPTWWFMLRFRLIAWRENRHDDETIKAWATYDAAAQDVGRALYVAETMIHMEILEGRDPAEAVSKHLNKVRDRFAIPYAKPEGAERDG